MTSRRACLPAAALLLAAAFAQSAPLAQPTAVQQLPEPQDRWALVVGVSHYDSASLTPLFGEQDATTIARDLVQVAGFPENQVIVLNDASTDTAGVCDASRDVPLTHGAPTSANIVNCLFYIANMVSPKGLLFVFFSGHGVNVDNDTFLLAKDSPPSSDLDFLKLRAIGTETIAAALRRSASKQVMLFVDACRDQLFSGTKGVSANVLTKQFADHLDFEKMNLGKRAYVTMFSSSVGQSSYSFLDRKMSYFTWELHQALSGVAGVNGGAYDTNGVMTLTRLLAYVQDNLPPLVKRMNAGKEQVPWTRVEGFNADTLVLAMRAGASASAPTASRSTVSRPTPSSVINPIITEQDLSSRFSDALVLIVGEEISDSSAAAELSSMIARSLGASNRLAPFGLNLAFNSAFAGSPRDLSTIDHIERIPLIVLGKVHTTYESQGSLATGLQKATVLLQLRLYRPTEHFATDFRSVDGIGAGFSQSLALTLALDRVARAFADLVR